MGFCEYYFLGGYVFNLNFLIIIDITNECKEDQTLLTV